MVFTDWRALPSNRPDISWRIPAAILRMEVGLRYRTKILEKCCRLRYDFRPIAQRGLAGGSWRGNPNHEKDTTHLESSGRRDDGVHDRHRGARGRRRNHRP